MKYPGFVSKATIQPVVGGFFYIEMIAPQGSDDHYHETTDSGRYFTDWDEFKQFCTKD